MTTYEGNILKMRTEYDFPVKYYLTLGESEIFFNSLIGKEIEIIFKERINCIKCNALTNKSFHQGYCYSCFTSHPECDVGVLHPEKDMSHLGISRDMQWAKENSLIDHYVYLAITGDLKIGVTRYTQIPTRWIDQGVISAIKLAKTPYRNLAGQIEVFLKQFLMDKTNIIKMLKTYSHNIDLIKEKKYYSELLNNDFKKYITYDNSITNIEYPYNYNIDKFNNINLYKHKFLSGKLIGIKAQYLIFSSGDILNIRAHSGYYITLTF